MSGQKPDWWKVTATIAAVAAATWTVVGPPKLLDLVEGGRLSPVAGALVWLVPSVVLWVPVWRCRHRWGRWLRERYLWVLSVLSRSVRGDLVARLSTDVDDGQANAGSDLHDSVRELSAVALHVLEQVLAAYDPAHGGNVVWKPEFVWIDSVRGRSVWDEPGAMVRAACEELKKARVFSRVQFAGAGGASVELDPRLRDVGVLLVREWARDELEMR